MTKWFAVAVSAVRSDSVRSTPGDSIRQGTYAEIVIIYFLAIRAGFADRWPVSACAEAESIPSV